MAGKSVTDFTATRPATESGTTVAPVRDRRGRPLRDLRISVMDRCNFRCPYCMPESTFPEDFRFLPPAERLSFDEIVRLARAAIPLGVTKLRLTGGEPLLRPQLPELVARLAALPGIEDVALTTNGVLLDRQAQALRAAGLHRVTVSIDALDPKVFARMSGNRGSVAAVLAGIEAARQAGFPGGVKLNAVVQRGVNDSEIVSLARHFRFQDVVLRFVEYMDVGTRNGWERSDVMTAREIRERLSEIAPLVSLPPTYPGEVARRYRFADGSGEIGLIASVTAPFCGGCTRARLSSDGRFYTCLFASQGADLRYFLRHENPSDSQLTAHLRSIWERRNDRYSEERGQFSGETRQWERPEAGKRGGSRQPRVEMNYIGG
ncbi:GTP 3',8-cyclase MoaA [Oecophyllibacter saccharovorans]|uniref:GTP 3',8-cyclase n=1 Tax=Oecophyllibacter saccharovorans TaxID=2558360 RepID=A0A506UM01_9PROT|nr:GTP 3',8-cyclase MoaA [Oecophyllibacter saccharovorans]